MLKPSLSNDILRFATAMFLGLMVVQLCAADANAQRRKRALGKKPSQATDKDAKAPATPNMNPAAPANPGATQTAPGRTSQGNDKNEFAPQIVTMDVKGEGIRLVATWFPPIIDDKANKKKKAQGPGEEEDSDKEPGKSTAPFILIHDWTRNRNDLLAMGSFLQSQGHAVLVPDLRGHGASTARAGSARLLDHTKFRKADKASAIGDIDQCKRFLQEKNNEGIVNMDLLNVVAVGDSSHLAISWAIADWSWEPVAGIKQGKDVKSLILFSPTMKFAGSSLKKLCKDPLLSGRSGPPLPMLVVWGGQSEAAKGCNEFIDMMRKFRPEAPAADDMATRWFKQNLFHFQAPTAMSGAEIAGNPQAQQIWKFANDFVSQKVLEFKDQCPWQLRGAEAVLKARAEQD